MNLTRTFLDRSFVLNETIQLEKRFFHHELNVLRKKSGDLFIVFDGKGNSAMAEILSTKKHFEICINKLFPPSPRSGIDFDLGQSIIKSDPFNIALQKAAELGVKTFSPLLTERVVMNRKSLDSKKRIEKWYQIARGACEQCGENWVPFINEPTNLIEWAKETSSRTKILLYPNAEQKLSDIAFKETVSIAIGPEGDFTVGEVEALKEFDFIPVTMGHRILRAETAAISVISAIRYGAKEF